MANFNFFVWFWYDFEFDLKQLIKSNFHKLDLIKQVFESLNLSVVLIYWIRFWNLYRPIPNHEILILYRKNSSASTSCNFLWCAEFWPRLQSADMSFSSLRNVSSKFYQFRKLQDRWQWFNTQSGVSIFDMDSQHKLLQHLSIFYRFSVSFRCWERARSSYIIVPDL